MSDPEKEVATDSSKTKDSTEPTPEKPAEPEPEPKIPFQCSVCKLINVDCDYFGTRPPFARKVQITEDSFVMKDPFSPPPSAGRPNAEYFLVVGSKCVFCEATVCKGSECSVFYSRTFCRKCSMENIKNFPIEIQTKVRKQFNKSTS